MKKIFFVFLLLLFSVNLFADDDEKLKLAVMEFEDLSGKLSKTMLSGATEYMRGAFVSTNKYVVIAKERQEKAMIAEMKKESYKSCNDKNCQIPLGQALSPTDYSCGCNSGYGWNGEACIKPLTLGNICTGQTKCFNNEAEITCPTSASADFYGQDAQYRSKCTAHSFKEITAFGQKIVIDKNTTLQWQQTISGTSYNWEDAIDYCENLKYGGYTDWRLPSPHELLTITDISRDNPAVNTTYFKIYIMEFSKLFRYECFFSR